MSVFQVLILCEEGEIMISEAVTVPKALADIFEALAGAIFFDSGRDLNAVWNVFYPLMHDVIGKLASFLSLGGIYDDLVLELFCRSNFYAAVLKKKC